MAGRRPKPTALKRLAGNPGKRPLNTSEAEFSAGAECPEILSPLARAEWERLAPELKTQGLLTEASRSTFASYCENWATWCQALQMVRKFNKVLTLPDGSKIELSGDVIVTKNGNAVMNPYRAIANRAAEMMRKDATELGLTPSSSSRVNASPKSPNAKEESVNPLRAFLQGRQRSNAVN